jgi:acetolactate synthase-1/2/3 large subunit
MNGAQSLVAALRDVGVEHIFGLPGDTGMALYDALFHEPSITHVMTRDERSASFMADVYARVSRRLGVCEGPSGGGATYIIPGNRHSCPVHDLGHTRERRASRRAD